MSDIVVTIQSAPIAVVASGASAAGVTITQTPVIVTATGAALSATQVVIDVQQVQVTMTPSLVGVDINVDQVAVAIGSGIGPQGVPGVAGPAGPPIAHLHTQSAAATTWTLNHNLGYRPDVACRNTGGQEIEGEVLHTTLNQAVVYFAVAVAGDARCL